MRPKNFKGRRMLRKVRAEGVKNPENDPRVLDAEKIRTKKDRTDRAKF